MPWRTGIGPARSGILGTASMRPRRGCRGEQLVLVSSKTVWEVLQCGHGEDAVENGEAAPKKKLKLKLQCGHGEDAVENLLWGPSGYFGHFGFNAATARMPWRTRVA